jgi:hypothetical protein
MNGRTPDERFLIQLDKLAQREGDSYQAIDVRDVAFAIGLKEIATKNIVKHLAQANFVVKISETEVALTPHGQALAAELVIGI